MRPKRNKSQNFSLFIGNFKKLVFSAPLNIGAGTQPKFC